MDEFVQRVPVISEPSSNFADADQAWEELKRLSVQRKIDFGDTRKILNILNEKGDFQEYNVLIGFKNEFSTQLAKTGMFKLEYNETKFEDDDDPLHTPKYRIARKFATLCKKEGYAVHEEISSKKLPNHGPYDRQVSLVISIYKTF